MQSGSGKEMEMSFKEKTINSEYIYKGAILNLRRDKVTVENGTSYREIVEHNGAVALVALTAEGNVVMVKQFRKPVERDVLEIPAGKIDGDEPSMEAAIRELREETGYTASDIRLLTKYYPSVGYSEEVIDIYLCTGLVPGETEFDEDESLDIYEIPLEELVDDILEGNIYDGKTMAAIMITAELMRAEK